MSSSQVLKREQWAAEPHRRKPPQGTYADEPTESLLQARQAPGKAECTMHYEGPGGLRNPSCGPTYRRWRALSRPLQLQLFLPVGYADFRMRV